MKITFSQPVSFCVQMQPTFVSVNDTTFVLAALNFGTDGAAYHATVKINDGLYEIGLIGKRFTIDFL